MKLLLILFLVVMPQGSDLRIKYDRIEDRTNVSTKPASKGSLSILLYVNHRGQKLAEPKDKVGLLIESYSRDWEFLKPYSQTLFVLAGEDRFSLSNPMRDSSVTNYRDYHGSVGVTERLVFALSKADLEKIVKADHVEMKIGRFTFDLDKKMRQQFAAMLEYITP